MTLQTTTPPGAVASGTDVLQISPQSITHAWTLDLRLWAIAYSLEEARTRYTEEGKHRRAFCIGVVLALLRIAGVQL